MSRGPNDYPKESGVPRMVPEREVLRARPVNDPIDSAALTQEQLRRYPKIIAALAAKPEVPRP